MPQGASIEKRSWIERITIWLLIIPIRGYQIVLRPHLLGSCKFCPTCSQYAIEALLLHGPLRGGLLSARRLLRCRPLSPGGIDPVPTPSH